MTLVDTSVWIDYFHNGITADVVDVLIEENKLCTTVMPLFQSSF